MHRSFSPLRLHWWCIQHLQTCWVYFFHLLLRESPNLWCQFQYESTKSATMNLLSFFLICEVIRVTVLLLCNMSVSKVGMWLIPHNTGRYHLAVLPNSAACLCADTYRSAKSSSSAVWVEHRHESNNIKVSQHVIETCVLFQRFGRRFRAVTP